MGSKMIQPPPELPEWFKLAAADGKVGSIELAKLLGIRVTTLDSRVTNGQFPEPDIRQNANWLVTVKNNKRLPRYWKISTVRNWFKTNSQKQPQQ